MRATVTLGALFLSTLIVAGSGVALVETVGEIAFFVEGTKTLALTAAEDKAPILGPVLDEAELKVAVLTPVVSGIANNGIGTATGTIGLAGAFVGTVQADVEAKAQIVGSVVGAIGSNVGGTANGAVTLAGATGAFALADAQSCLATSGDALLGTMLPQTWSAGNALCLAATSEPPAVADGVLATTIASGGAFLAAGQDILGQDLIGDAEAKQQLLTSAALAIADNAGGAANAATTLGTTVLANSLATTNAIVALELNAIQGAGDLLLLCTLSAPDGEPQTLLLERQACLVMATNGIAEA